MSLHGYKNLKTSTFIAILALELFLIVIPVRTGIHEHEIIDSQLDWE